MSTGILFDLRRYSIHDGPGIRTSVFLKGCPLACAWCHNPEGIHAKPELIFRRGRCSLCGDCLPACPESALAIRGEILSIDREKCALSAACVQSCPAEALEVVGSQVTVAGVMDALEKDRLFYEESGGGVTFTGGEPFAQSEFLLRLLQECRRARLHTAVDTSGYVPWEVLQEALPFVDLFLFDLKLMDEYRHIQWTGVANALILENLRRLSAVGQKLLVRIPLIPGVNDDEANLRSTGEFLASLPEPPPVEMLPYHNIARSKYEGLGRQYQLADLQPPSREKTQACAAILREYALQVKP